MSKEKTTKSLSRSASSSSLDAAATDEMAGMNQLGDGRLFKMEVDYAGQVDDAVPKAEQIAKEGNVMGALESLYGLEKQTRLGADMKSNAKIVQAMVRICFDGNELGLLNETITMLAKKRSLIKLAIARMVRDACALIDKIPSEADGLRLIETLRTITAGKIYVEVERARLTSRLAKKMESEGKQDEACALLLELQVETYGSMQIKEKVEFLLEQMRLCVARRDFVRASIISKKISTRFFEDKTNEVQQLKLKYYQLMIEIGQHESAYLDICRYYRAVFDTPIVQQDNQKLEESLKNVVLYVLLAPHDNEQWDMLHRIQQLRAVERIPDYREAYADVINGGFIGRILELFTTEELISWRQTIAGVFEPILRRGTASSPATHVFERNEMGEVRWKHLHSRVGEHNMRMIAKYYTQISFDRMAELLDYPVDMETFLCQLIVSGVIVDARIDRPARLVDLRSRRAPVEQLDQWTSSVRKLTDILNKVSHLILKEEMVHHHLNIHG